MTACLQLLALVADNASNNNTLVTALAIKIGRFGRFNGALHRIRYFAHILNLVMKAFLRVFLRVKKSVRAQGTADEWNVLEKEAAKYDAADSDSEAGDSDVDEMDSEEDENDGDKEGDTPVDTDIDAARNAADDELIDELEDGDKCTGSQLDDNIELPPLTVEERK
ncbi:hypothetical protein B0H16DRAFT_1753367 [Mycena metata]|uniref:Uncharacterized protein n=1 Tax=Mycena metata TaxID=1033252 RepID=A0AAD7KH24_9AGAR|nr:hypothetical protein B0H16DRAFT_1753367 [Mycena metata]